MRLKHAFLGYDHRAPVAHTVLDMSIREHAKRPVSITPLVLHQLPIKRAGLTPFTYSRFLVPYLMGYRGWAVFLDTDMMLRADINELFDFADESKAIMVVKNEKRFEWASAMLINCAACEMLTPEFIESAERLHTLEFLPDEKVGELPPEWNHLVGYDPPRPRAKLVHFTQGIPAFPETEGSEYQDEWRSYVKMATSAVSWGELMGRSVHAANVGGQLLPKWKAREMGYE